MEQQHTQLIAEQIKRMREPVRIARNQQLELFKSELNLLIAQKEVIQKELNDKNSDDENKPSKSDLRDFAKAIQEITSKEMDIEHLNRMSIDTIAKIALPYTTEALETLKNISKDHRFNRIVVTVATYRVVQIEVERFREENPDWAEWVPELLRKRKQSNGSLLNFEKNGESNTTKRSNEDQSDDSTGGASSSKRSKLRRSTSGEEKSQTSVHPRIEFKNDSEPLIKKPPVENNFKITIPARGSVTKRVVEVNDSSSSIHKSEGLRHRLDSSSRHVKWADNKDESPTSRVARKEKERHERSILLPTPPQNPLPVTSRLGPLPGDELIEDPRPVTKNKNERYLEKVIQDRAQLNHEVNTLKEELNALHAKLNDRNTDHTKLTLTINELNHEMKELKLANETLVNQLKMEEDRCQTLEEEIYLLRQKLQNETDLREQLSSMNQNLKESYEKQLQALQERLTEAESVVERQNAESKPLGREELEEIRRILLEEIKQRVSLAKDLTSLREKVATHEALLEANQKTLGDKDQEIQQLRTKVEPLETNAKKFVSLITQFISLNGNSTTSDFQ